MTTTTTHLNETQRDIAALSDDTLADDLLIWQQTVTALRNSDANDRSIGHAETIVTWHQDEVNRRANNRASLPALRAIQAAAWAKVLATPAAHPDFQKVCDLHRAAAAAVKAAR